MKKEISICLVHMCAQENDNNELRTYYKLNVLEIHVVLHTCMHGVD